MIQKCINYLASNFRLILLQLQKIILVQFKNHLTREFEFSGRIIGIAGINGAGKTNLLDAIYYLCFTKSYFSKSDIQNAHMGSAGFRIEGHFMLDGKPVEVVAILRENGKKEFLWNGEAYEKFSAHIGRISAVMIAPDDVQIITNGSEERRRYLDALLCQLDPKYLQSLIEYNRMLLQRNSFLKSLVDKTNYDQNLLDVYDAQLTQPGLYVFQKRQLFLASLLPSIRTLYFSISGKHEDIKLQYESPLLESSFEQLLKRSRKKDLLFQRTNNGIHKDDINILLNGQAFKTIGSQGQRKSLLFAMKLAEYEMLKTAKGFATDFIAG